MRGKQPPVSIWHIFNQKSDIIFIGLDLVHCTFTGLLDTNIVNKQQALWQLISIIRASRELRLLRTSQGCI
jgi:hypothetical protein